METVKANSRLKTRTTLYIVLIVFFVLLGVPTLFRVVGNNSEVKVLSQALSEPANGATSAKLDIHRYSGDLAIDRSTSGKQDLASGLLPYLENQELIRSADTINGQATLTFKTNTKSSGFRLPWVGCNDDTQWQIHLTPGVPFEITAYSGGGTMALNLTGMTISRVSAETGGGNVSVVLPDQAADLLVSAKTGAGNVLVTVPAKIAAKIYIETGAGKVSLDPRFSKIDDKTYLSPGYDNAVNKADITIKSGAGNVTVETN